MSNHVLYAKDGALLTITLNRPDKRNALNGAMREGLWDAWRRFEADKDLRVAILTGAGEKAFCAGIDLVEFSESRVGVPPPNFLPVLGQNIQVTKPVIAAVNGFAYAGGWRLAQMCDLCIASDNAHFAITEARVGRGAPWASPLTHMVPPRIMMELLLTGNPITAQRAYEIGFVNHVVPQAALMSRARQMADDIVAGAPLFLKAAKAMVYAGMEAGAIAGISQADALFEPMLTSQDAIEGPLAFKEKRKPRWQGR